MGEAKRERQRLGEWYGKPVGPGHPDYVESEEQPKPPTPRTMSPKLAMLFGLAAIGHEMLTAPTSPTKPRR